MVNESTSVVATSSATDRWEGFPTSPLGLALFAAAICLVSLWYSWYTAQIWEDALITLRHSENMINGQGLVYNSGERIHGFTSPINVLLLAACYLLTGKSSYVATLWMYRIFTIAAFAGGGVLALLAMARAAPRWTPAIWFFAIIYLFEPKTVAYCTNGMETGFMMLFVGWGIYLLTLGPADRWVARGLCAAGLMWTRPDGFVYIAILALAELLFFRDRPWPATLQSLAKSAGLCALIYSPWFLSTWWYYGSPIPHTVIAKSNAEQGTPVQIGIGFEGMPENIFATAGRIFRPIQLPAIEFWIVPMFWSHVIYLASKLLSACALFYWLLPVPDRLGRATSFCFLLLCGYFSFHIFSGLWYYPPAILFANIALARASAMLVVGARHLGSLAKRERLCKAVALASITLLATGQIALFAANSRAEMIWQKEIEDGQRSAIGTWLKEHGKPDQTVYLEPLGYIGYFSGMKMIDFPGLVSPEVVRLRREKQINTTSGVPYLLPDWLVLRYWEARQLADSSFGEKLKQDYTLEKLFNVNDKVDQYGQIANNAMIRYDAAYAVFRKNHSNEPVAPPALPPGN